MNKELIQAPSDWSAQIKELQTLLESLRPQLIEAEANLTEKIADITAFEFKLRAQIAPLVERLERLQGEVQALKKQLRQMRDDWFFAQSSENLDGLDDWSATEWQFGAGSGATATGEYRYMGPEMQPPPQELNEDSQETLKKLYRQLARRFHPDLAESEVDRAYYTQMMMRINAAYAAGDLEQLQQIALEPDSITHAEGALSDQQLAEALLREVARCQRRLVEIKEELARLAQHRNARLLEKARQAEKRGIDFLQKMAAELQEKITHKRVERDVLEQQIEMFAEEEIEFAGDDFADTMYDLNLEQIFEDDPDLAAEHWSWKRRARFSFEDDEAADDLDY